MSVWLASVFCASSFIQGFNAVSPAQSTNEMQALPSTIDLFSTSSAFPGKIESDDFGKYLLWEDSLQSFQWDFDIAAAGEYQIVVSYALTDDAISAVTKRVLVDDQQLGGDACVVEFPQRWKYLGKPYKNQIGDYVRPKQQLVTDMNRVTLYDSTSTATSPLSVKLETGQHSLTLETVSGGLKIYGIDFVKVPSIPSYQEVLTQYQQAGYQESSERIYIEAEDVTYRSESSIRIECNSDPIASPPAGSNTVFNTIGSRWNQANQFLEWEFDVPKSGLYKLDLRAYQKYTDGLPVFRQITIDGTVPFQEFLSYRFDYSDWNTITLSDGEKPYLIYLSEGKHTLGMSVKTDEFLPILEALSETLVLLSENVQNIIMITGITPDINFDYRLEEKIPNLMDNFKRISSIITAQCGELKKLSNKSPGAINSLQQVAFQIDKLLENPFSIPKQLTFLMDSQTTISSWLKEFNNMPLLLDYIVFESPQHVTENPHSNFFQILTASIKSLLLSFVKDYDNISGFSAPEEDTIDVWISRGKEWGEILKQLCDEQFSPDSGVAVNLNILPAGQMGTSGVLLLAIASDTVPDVALGVDMLLPTEYGMRGAITDLTKMSNYQTISQRFLPGSLRAYSFENAVYAVPETIDMSVLYYRKDVLENLHIDPKDLDTWDTVYSKVLPKLKQSGMDFWYEGGLNTFLYQNGGDYYTEDGKHTALDTPQAFEAFRQFTNLYRIYNVPVSANFYTRFRAGQMPIGISSLNTYMLLSYASPELHGKWGALPIPATIRPDGSKSRACSGSTSAAVIMQTSDKKEKAWKFLDWYTSAETQILYATELMATIGQDALWYSANTEAFDRLPWDNDLKEAIKVQRQEYIDSRNVIGGYITGRHVENARVRVVVNGMNYREALEKSIQDINRELERKNKEFEMRTQKK